MKSLYCFFTGLLICVSCSAMEEKIKKDSDSLKALFLYSPDLSCKAFQLVTEFEKNRFIIDNASGADVSKVFYAMDATKQALEQVLRNPCKVTIQDDQVDRAVVEMHQHFDDILEALNNIEKEARNRSICIIQ